jgi:hypothetical protein
MQRTPGDAVSGSTAVVETHGLGERYGAIDASGASDARVPIDGPTSLHTSQELP